ncbi:MAG: hypothetical protein VKK03_02820 [Synechococcus sp.]|nr:hypothetical protein [Synechococcus sp.]
MTLNSPLISLVVLVGLFAVLQVWWLGSLMRRRQRNRLAAPLSSKDFRDQLERIFRAN